MLKVILMEEFSGMVPNSEYVSLSPSVPGQEKLHYITFTHLAFGRHQVSGATNNFSHFIQLSG